MNSGPVSRNVWVLRHAKAAADSPDGDDHSRPLTKRGRRQAEAAAEFLSDVGAAGAPLPSLVLCSTAARAVQTAELVLPALGSQVTLDLERDLYTADADDVIDRLRQLDDDVSSVMVVGHNPALGDLVLLLVSNSDVAGRRQLEVYPTCALARIALGSDSWARLSEHCGTLENFFAPER